jgi:pseudaminic acid synthase
VAIPNLSIADRVIGLDYPPFIIAEMSGNHNQSIDRALAIVEACAEAGAHAIKLQTYTADTMTLDIREGEFVINDPMSLWHGRTLYDLYEEAHTPWEWHKPIFERCRELGIIPFSTPFDQTAVDFLETLDAPCYKVASFENTDLPLIRRIAATGKPIIISTGMASIAELDEIVRTVRAEGCQDFALLKCTSNYPSIPEDSHVATIPHLRDLFQCQVGLSDHTMGIGVAVASVALGAIMLEKHFTLARADGGVDSAFSLEPDELQNLVTESERAWQSLGQVTYGTQGADMKSKVFRRSLYVIQDMKAGDVFTEKNLRAIRPGFGLPPKEFEFFLGKEINRDVKKGTALSWGLVG